jgi:hypothetical protein
MPLRRITNGGRESEVNREGLEHVCIKEPKIYLYVRFEIFTVVAMKNVVFWKSHTA